MSVVSKQGGGAPLTFEEECKRCGLKIVVSIDRFQNPEYINWIKSTLCLQYTKEGIENFVIETSKEYHIKMKPYIMDAVMCPGHCQMEAFRKQNFKCPSGKCDELRKQLLDSCVLDFRPVWSNSTLTDIMSTPFELAKLFMPKLCMKHNSPKDADCTAIFTLMDNCEIFLCKIANAILVDKVRETRNAIMHSGTMSLGEKELFGFKQQCINLLNDPRELQQDNHCRDAICKIEQLCNENIRIEQLKDVEAKVLKEYDDEKQADVENLEKAVESKNCAPEELIEITKRIKEYLERDAKLEVMMGIYNIDSKTTSERKGKLNSLHEKTMKKHAHLLANKLKEKDDEITKVKTQADNEIMQWKLLADKRQNDLDCTKQSVLQMMESINITGKFNGNDFFLKQEEEQQRTSSESEPVTTESESETNSNPRFSQVANNVCSATALFLNGDKLCPGDMHNVVLATGNTLRTLYIIFVDLSTLGDKLADLFSSEQLSSISLSRVKLSHNQCNQLSNYLSAVVELSSIEIWDLSCTSDHTCQSLLNVTSRNRQLHENGIDKLPLKTKVLHSIDLEACRINYLSGCADVSILESLRDASNLKELCLRCCSSPRTLANVLPRLDGLLKLSLCEIDFGNLTDIRLSNRASQLKRIDLSHCDISAAGLDCLVDSLPAQTVEVTLWRVKIRDGKKHFLERIRSSSKTDITADRPGDDEEVTRWFVFYINM